jgi:hypothetical protein
VEQGLSLPRIYQDLVSEHQFQGSYHSVRRYVHRRQGGEAELPCRRMECQPGEEMQVDFGLSAWVVEGGPAAASASFPRCAELLPQGL